jgi:hypothetical protein
MVLLVYLLVLYHTLHTHITTATPACMYTMWTVLCQCMLITWDVWCLQHNKASCSANTTYSLCYYKCYSTQLAHTSVPVSRHGARWHLLFNHQFDNQSKPIMCGFTQFMWVNWVCIVYLYMSIFSSRVHTYTWTALSTDDTVQHKHWHNNMSNGMQDAGWISALITATSDT